jgi:pyruvate formate lyase activating enzyme
VSLSKLGLIKTSLLDYPAEVAAVLFTPGCNLRCPFCHNPELVATAAPDDFLPIDEIFAFLKRRSRVLGGVCITGGEPLMHPDLPELVGEIRSLGLKCKVDTNGTFPDRLQHLAADYVALDIKTSPAKYKALGQNATGIQRDLFDSSLGPEPDIWAKVRKSSDWLATAADTTVEFRTTVVPDLVGLSDIEHITDFLADYKHSLRYTLAGFRQGETLDPAYADRLPYPPEVLEQMRDIAIAKGLECSIRWNGSQEPTR